MEKEEKSNTDTKIDIHKLLDQVKTMFDQQTKIMFDQISMQGFRISKLENNFLELAVKGHVDEDVDVVMRKKRKPKSLYLRKETIDKVVQRVRELNNAEEFVKHYDFFRAMEEICTILLSNVERDVNDNFLESELFEAQAQHKVVFPYENYPAHVIIIHNPTKNITKEIRLIEKQIIVNYLVDHYKFTKGQVLRILGVYLSKYLKKFVYRVNHKNYYDIQYLHNIIEALNTFCQEFKNEIKV